MRLASVPFVNDPRRRNRMMVADWNMFTFTWDDYIDRPADLCSTVAAPLDAAPRRNSGCQGK